VVDNFIGIFDNVVSSDTCKTIINHFEKVQSVSRHSFQRATDADNEVYFLQREQEQILIDQNHRILQEFNNATNQSMEIYRQKYPVLNDTARYQMNYDVKIQKTLPGQGYHRWHCERDSVLNARRLLLVMLYLNTNTDGGETEFIYQHKRIEPQEGRMVICPSTFTHTHRGNPPLSGVKYMINGWIEFIE
jgi:hypothetical protein